MPPPTGSIRMRPFSPYPLLVTRSEPSESVMRLSGSVPTATWRPAAFPARLVTALDDLRERRQAAPGDRSFRLDGPPVLGADYRSARPDRRAEVKALVKPGRLQVGPWYVLADELIPSGEALVRNLLLGAADAERLGGRLDVLYSPDAFGHPAVWPTLAREFGIRAGVVWRGLGGER